MLIFDCHMLTKPQNCIIDHALVVQMKRYASTEFPDTCMGVA